MKKKSDVKILADFHNKHTKKVKPKCRTIFAQSVLFQDHAWSIEIYYNKHAEADCLTIVGEFMGYIDYPICYETGKVAFCYPEAIPERIKRIVRECYPEIRYPDKFPIHE